MTLPKSKTNEKTNKQFISLSVTEDKKFYLDKQPVLFTDLETQLMSKIGTAKDQTVIVRMKNGSTRAIRDLFARTK